MKTLLSSASVDSRVSRVFWGRGGEAAEMKRARHPWGRRARFVRDRSGRYGVSFAKPIRFGLAGPPFSMSAANHR